MDDSDLISGTIRGFLEGIPSLWYPWRMRRKKKSVLRGLLRDREYKWRSTEALQSSIAATRQETEELLLEIGARRSGDKQDLWTIKR
jgi:hypothetical protein